MSFFKSVVFVGVVLCGLCSCDDKDQSFEAMTAVKMEGEVVDWNAVLELAQEDDVFVKACAGLDGVKAGGLREKTSFLADVKSQELRVVVTHEDQALAELWSAAVAGVVEKLCLEAEAEKAFAELSAIEDQLKGKVTLEVGTLERDQMSYQRALEALNSEQTEGGVLYQREEKAD